MESRRVGKSNGIGVGYRQRTNSSIAQGNTGGGAAGQGQIGGASESAEGHVAIAGGGVDGNAGSIDQGSQSDSRRIEITISGDAAGEYRLIGIEIEDINQIGAGISRNGSQGNRPIVGIQCDIIGSRLDIVNDLDRAGIAGDGQRDIGNDIIGQEDIAFRGQRTGSDIKITVKNAESTR